MSHTNYDPDDAKAALKEQGIILGMLAKCLALFIVLAIPFGGLIWTLQTIFAANPGLDENIGKIIGIACGLGLFGILLGMPIYFIFHPTINLVVHKLKGKRKTR